MADALDEKALAVLMALEINWAPGALFGTGDLPGRRAEIALVDDVWFLRAEEDGRYELVDLREARHQTYEGFASTAASMYGAKLAAYRTLRALRARSAREAL